MASTTRVAPSRNLSTRVQVNAYASWTSVQGFGVHWDDHGVIVVQVSGRKRWRIYGFTRHAPLYSDQRPRPAPPRGRRRRPDRSARRPTPGLAGGDRAHRAGGNGNRSPHRGAGARMGGVGFCSAPRRRPGHPDQRAPGRLHLSRGLGSGGGVDGHRLDPRRVGGSGRGLQFGALDHGSRSRRPRALAPDPPEGHQ
nr:cupin domain-containing protein [Streptomonospora nanhaiensis]